VLQAYVFAIQGTLRTFAVRIKDTVILTMDECLRLFLLPVHIERLCLTVIRHYNSDLRDAPTVVSQTVVNVCRMVLFDNASQILKSPLKFI